MAGIIIEVEIALDVTFIEILSASSRAIQNQWARFIIKLSRNGCSVLDLRFLGPVPPAGIPGP